MPNDAEATFSDKARSEAEYLLKTHAPGKVGTPEGEQEIKAFLAGTRFSEKHYADEIERLQRESLFFRKALDGYYARGDHECPDPLHNDIACTAECHRLRKMIGREDTQL